jgi:hypothetical protein
MVTSSLPFNKTSTFLEPNKSLPQAAKSRRCGAEPTEGHSPFANGFKIWG